MANEKRLIDANALLETIDKSDRDNFHKGVANRSIHHYEHIHFLKMVMDAPTVDAVEVVHARWKYYHKQNKAVCTNCSFERDLDENFGKAVSCPNCGAKMDGGNEDNVQKN